MSEVGTAVIGSGFIGTVHIEALRRIGVQVHGLLGSSADRAYEQSSRLGVPRAYGSLAELLDDERVTVVHVTSPNHLHHAHVRQILAASRHVVCEKPLAMTSTESAELVALAAASDRVAAVNFNLRFYALNQHLRQFVAEGRLGEGRLVSHASIDAVCAPTNRSTWSWSRYRMSFTWTRCARPLALTSQLPFRRSADARRPSGLACASRRGMVRVRTAIDDATSRSWPTSRRPRVRNLVTVAKGKD